MKEIKIKHLLLTFFVFNVADIAATWYGTHMKYGYEANPIMDWFIKRGWSWAILFKMTVTLLSMFLIWRGYVQSSDNERERRKVVWVVYGVNILYVIIMLQHLNVWLHYKGVLE